MRKGPEYVQSSILASSLHTGVGLHSDNVPSTLLFNAFHFTGAGCISVERVLAG